MILLQFIPRFTLNWGAGEKASVFLTAYKERSPLLLSDIQHLITYAYGGNELVLPPSRWCKLEKSGRLVQIVVLFVEGVGLEEFVDSEDCFPRTMGVFGSASAAAAPQCGDNFDDEKRNKAIVEFLSPHWYGASLATEVSKWGILSPYSYADQIHDAISTDTVKQQSDNAEQVDLPDWSNEQVIQQLGSVFPIKNLEMERLKELELPEGDTFSRTYLVLSLPQLIQESYPLPIPASREFGYMPTALSYSPLNSRSKMFAFDCEMCATVDDDNALVRIGVVDEQLKVVYTTLVKPQAKITDYRTRWSGVNERMLRGVTVTLEQVQDTIKDIVKQYPDCIFVGQSLNCDLRVLKESQDLDSLDNIMSE